LHVGHQEVCHLPERH